MSGVGPEKNRIVLIPEVLDRDHEYAQSQQWRAAMVCNCGNTMTVYRPTLQQLPMHAAAER